MGEDSLEDQGLVVNGHLLHLAVEWISRIARGVEGLEEVATHPDLKRDRSLIRCKHGGGYILFDSGDVFECQIGVGEFAFKSRIKRYGDTVKSHRQVVDLVRFDRRNWPRSARLDLGEFRRSAVGYSEPHLPEVRSVQSGAGLRSGINRHPEPLIADRAGMFDDAVPAPHLQHIPLRNQESLDRELWKVELICGW